MNDMKIVHFMLKTVKIIIVVILVLFLSGIILNIRPYMVLSGSMEDTIHTGSLCLIKTDYDFEKVKVNDIIAFHSFRGLNVFAVPYLGYAVDFLQKPVVFGSVFAVFCLITVVSDPNKLKKEKRKGAFYV